jgi:chemotaxis protein MotB
MSNKWLMTFADLLSLILTFFVLLYSMSVIEFTQWQEVIKSLSQRLNPNKTIERTPPAADISITRTLKAEALNLDYLYTIVSEKLLSNPEVNTKLLKVTKLEDKLIISLPHELTFKPGKSELNKEANTLVGFIGDVLGNIGNRVQVVGYTDPTPIKNNDFPSNWELSLNRAMIITGRLKSSGYLYKIDTVGRADATADYLSATLSKKDRYNFMRRVDILISAYEAKL